MKLKLLFIWICFILTHNLLADAVNVELANIEDTLFLKMRVQKDSPVLISSPEDEGFLWNEDDEGHRYYMIGVRGVRENIWCGVGHAENIDRDYLIIGIRNVDSQFGKFFAKNLVNNFTLNGVKNPGTVEDGGFDLYPYRQISVKKIAGVESVESWPSYFELGTNSFYLKIILKNNYFPLKLFTENNFVVLGDGNLEIKIKK